MTGMALTVEPPAILAGETDLGVSEEATAVTEQFGKVWRDRLQSIDFWRRYADPLEALKGAAIEAMDENWDGYGAAAVSPLTFSHAQRLLLALPATIPPPEIAVEPDGEIELEWFRRPRWVFSVSVGRSGDLTYAGLFGHSNARGTEYFTDEVPRAIVDNLRRLFSSHP